MKSNPYKLKLFKGETSWLSNSDELISFLDKNKIPIKRKDNLPRFAYQNNIQMYKMERDGSAGSVPTVYKIPTSNKISEIFENMKNNNNSILGKDILKKKKAKILEIFDKAEIEAESRTSIAKK